MKQQQQQYPLRIRKMPINNNQKVQSAAARLAKLPVVRSACTKLSVLYIDTKRSHPSLRSVCDAVESRVTAVVAPVMVKLEPQISIANGVACKSLDWLETAFPVINTPTEQIIATAKNKMLEIQAVVSIAAYGTRDCVEYTVAWVTGSTQPAGDQAGRPLAKRPTRLGKDSARMVRGPLAAEEDAEEKAHLVEADLWRGCTVRLVSLVAKLCRTTYHVVGSKMHCAQISENLCRSKGLVQDLQTGWMAVTCSLQVLPQYVQHQLVSAFFFIAEMYKLSCPEPKRRSHRPRSVPKAAEVQVYPQAKTPCRMRWQAKTPGFDVLGC
ncbi:perilipin-5-like isoform X2 [Pungitius pungitius]|uniref:perilipin-5-like isoform X2 n=1 Tax=Pungitius pungitius TaxID=134920 RepID=UPI002E107973